MASRKRILASGPNDGMNAHPSIVQAEGASETFVKGALLVNGSAGDEGYLVEAGADPTLIVGVAEEAGENNATAGAASVRYTPALPHLTFEGTIDDNTGLYALLATDKFKKYGIAKDSDGIWYIDQSDTSNTCVVIVGFKDPVGTAAARVYFKFLNGKTIYE